jgi:subtilisin family serine protease
MLSANALDVGRVRWNGEFVDAVKNEYVLRMPQLNTSTARSLLDYRCEVPSIRPGWSLTAIGSGFFKLTAPGATQEVVAGWARRAGAESVNVNAIRRLSETPNDPLYADAANWAFPRVSADKAWDVGTGTKSTVIAVMDSGVDYNHPDLAANIWRNPNETAGDGIDNDKNGWIDDIYGVNTIAGTSNPLDDRGHGTMSAGLIAAVGDNAKGMAGVNWTAQIMAVKIFDANGNTSISAEVQGIQYIIGQKIAGQNVAAVNCSFGGYAYVQQEFDALNQLGQAGVIIVAAAGNDGVDNDATPAYPASYQIPALISVAASTPADALAGFSNYGKTSVDLAAPGVQLLSTRAAQANASTYAPYNGNGDYTTGSGTSFAAPLVAGTVGLLKSLKASASSQQVKDAVLNGVDKVSGLTGKVLSGGRLNVSKAATLMNASPGATPVASFKSSQGLKFLEGDNGYSIADIKVVLDRPCDPGKSAAVWFDTLAGGSAVRGTDFVSQSGSITFSGGETEKSIRVRLVGERIAEADEQFVIRLDGVKSNGVAVGDGLATVTILDDDTNAKPGQPGGTDPLLPRVTIQTKADPADSTGISRLAIVEGGVATFVVSLDKTSNKPVSVKYRTTQPALVPSGTAIAGSDYVATSGTMTFQPGERSKEFSVRILADRIADPNETFQVVLTGPVNAQLGGQETGAGGGAQAGGSTATATITDVPYIPPQAPGFQITLNYLGNVPASIRSATIWAASRWSQVITGDLPDVIDPSTGRVIDDLVIDVQVGLLGASATDGVGGTLANAGPDQFRSTGTRLPWKASAGIDPADATNPLLQKIVLHEFGHAIGFGGYVFARNQLVDSSGLGFIGANALREYRATFGLPAALSVPLEAGGGTGTAGGHWAEDVFQSELMTGFVAGATSLPLSRITVGALADLGYTVNYAKADAFAKPAIRATVASSPANSATSKPAATPLSIRTGVIVAGQEAVGLQDGIPPNANAEPRPLGRRSAFSALAFALERGETERRALLGGLGGAAITARR